MHQIINLSATKDEKRHPTNGQNQCDVSEAEQARLENLLTKLNSAFRNELPPGVPPSRETDHAIEILFGSKPTLGYLFQLSPTELQATKEHIADLLSKGKIRPIRYPYGAPLFFVKQKGKPPGVIDYRDLNSIKKQTVPLFPVQRKFLTGWALGPTCKAKVFSKIDLKAGFQQLRVHGGGNLKDGLQNKIRVFRIFGDVHGPLKRPGDLSVPDELKFI